MSPANPAIKPNIIDLVICFLYIRKEIIYPKRNVELSNPVIPESRY